MLFFFLLFLSVGNSKSQQTAGSLTLVTECQDRTAKSSKTTTRIRARNKTKKVTLHKVFTTFQFTG